MYQARAKKKTTKYPRKRELILPKCFENITPIPYVNANVLLHGYPGGVRHEAIDVANVLRRYNFHVEHTPYGYVVSKVYQDGELYTFVGNTLNDILYELKDDDDNCRVLYHHVCRDPIEQVKLFVEDSGYPLSVDEYLFNEVPDEHRETQLTVCRVYRKLLGSTVDMVTKWSQAKRFGDGYVAFKFPVKTDKNVYHVGAGNKFGQTFRGIETTGVIRCTDPQRDGRVIELNPPEPVCVSDCSYLSSDGLGMGNVSYFYTFYENWIESGKEVYFKGDLCYPPTFPCVILETGSKPHNREFIGYAVLGMVDIPDYVEERAKMSRANALRDRNARDGIADWPEYDKERVEFLLCKKVDYDFRIPSVVNKERKVCGKARFPITREQFGWRCRSDMAATPFNGISNSVICWMFDQLSYAEEGVLLVDMHHYPFFENHQFPEELLWSFEECASRLGLTRTKHILQGSVEPEPRKNYIRLVETSAARH